MQPMWLILAYCCCCFAQFVATWQTTAALQSINPYGNGPYSRALGPIAVDWGDGTPQETAANGDTFSLAHVYATAGSYNMTITGNFFWRNPIGGTPPQMLTDIYSWGGLTMDEQSSGLFEGCSNLRVSAPPDTQPRMQIGTFLTRMFEGTLFDAPLQWDLSNVFVLDRMFANTPLNHPIQFTNTGGVQSLYRVFYNCPNFNQPFSFDGSSVQGTSEMFRNAYSFNSPVEITNTGDTLVTVRSMFESSAFNQPFTLNTSSVTDMSAMFRNATSFNQPLDFVTDKVTTLASMFESASDFSSSVTFSNTSEVVNMSSVFRDTPFSQNLEEWDVSSVRWCDHFCSFCSEPWYRCRTNAPTNSPTNSPTTTSPTTNSPTTRSPTTRSPTTVAPTRYCNSLLRCYDCTRAGCKWAQSATGLGCASSCIATAGLACHSSISTCPETQDSGSFCTGYCGASNRIRCSCAPDCQATRSCCRDYNHSCPA